MDPPEGALIVLRGFGSPVVCGNWKLPKGNLVGNPNMFPLRSPGRKNCFGPNVRCWSMLVPRSTLEGHIFDDEMFQFLARAKDRTGEA